MNHKGIIIFLVIIFSAIIYGGFFSGMPDYNRDAIFSIPQSSIITDRNHNELFRFFDQDRRRVSYDEISPYMIDAIVVTEDQTFRSNDGVDDKAIARSIFNNISRRFGGKTPLQGGSTITQQLVKNIFLTNKKTLKRKMQETILAQKLTRNEIKLVAEKSPNTNTGDHKKIAKQSIMSMYLNYVFLGNQSYGVQAAAQNYFHKSAAQLTLLESTILASLPQAPTLYNPVLDSKKVLGYRAINDGETIQQYEINATNKILSGINMDTFDLQNITPKNCLQQIETIAQTQLSLSGTNYTAQYQRGRKDHILCTLYQEKYITIQELQQARQDSRNLNVYRARLPLYTPHFVFWVKQKVPQIPQLRAQGITIDNLVTQGYTIQTTIDQDYQRIAQDAVDNYMGLLRKNGGNNRALIHTDSTNGDVLAYIGSQDFYNNEIEGQNDIIQASKQVGSTLKPFFYTYLLSTYQSAITDIIGDYPIPSGPANHDRTFRGKTTIASALAGSRNLPVVRIFLALGKNETFVPYLRSLGFGDLDNKRQYGYPLALGAGEHTMEQLADAYAHIAATGDRHHSINPILSITDGQGNIIYQKKQDQKPLKKIIPDAIGQMMRNILSTKQHMPASRRGRRDIPLENFALKSGTSDKKSGTQLFPRDARMTLYTPQDVVVSRAGNTNGQAMGPKAFGGAMNHYVLRQYITELKNQNLINDIPRTTNATLPKRKELNKEQQDMIWGG